MNFSQSVIPFLLVYNIIGIRSTKSDSCTDIISFCKNNGYKFLTYIDLNQTNTKSFLRIAWKHGVSARIFKNSNIVPDIIDFLIVSHPNLDQFTKVLSLISNHKVQKSLLIINNLEDFQALVSKTLNENHMLTGLFYLYTEYSNWKQVLIVQRNTRVIINEVEYHKNTSIVKLNENLQQLELVPTTLSWPPYVKFNSSCNSNGRNCSYEGMLVDCMNIWSKHLNFTWDLQNNTKGDWGIKSGNIRDVKRIKGSLSYKNIVLSFYM